MGWKKKVSDKHSILYYYIWLVGREKKEKVILFINREHRKNTMICIYDDFVYFLLLINQHKLDLVSVFFDAIHFYDIFYVDYYHYYVYYN